MRNNHFFRVTKHVGICWRFRVCKRPLGEIRNCWEYTRNHYGELVLQFGLRQNQRHDYCLPRQNWAMIISYWWNLRDQQWLLSAGQRSVSSYQERKRQYSTCQSCSFRIMLIRSFDLNILKAEDPGQHLEKFAPDGRFRGRISSFLKQRLFATYFPRSLVVFRRCVYGTNENNENRDMLCLLIACWIRRLASLKKYIP